ncbi:hypothetical protein TBK1r_18450 [Stieleria magnilauensis]|uniref:Uncharacterized protein n=1 Tax=Stieleria magnilauensis TaxID=2527963 RepID=A0ABX5XLQ0_9BACT|nr:hypothetical protein TBK1r_18450 [Planctomycetes bacterium TBK1r]
MLPQPKSSINASLLPATYVVDTFIIKSRRQIKCQYSLSALEGAKRLSRNISALNLSFVINLALLSRIRMIRPFADLGMGDPKSLS